MVRAKEQRHAAFFAPDTLVFAPANAVEQNKKRERT